MDITTITYCNVGKFFKYACILLGLFCCKYNEAFKNGRSRFSTKLYNEFNTQIFQGETELPSSTSYVHNSASAFSKDTSLFITFLLSNAILLGCSNIASAADFSVTMSQAVAPSVFDYWRYFLSGGVCCAISHGVSVPFDVVKTKLQIAPEIYSSDFGILGTAKKIVKEDGLKSLLKGLGPTLVGYSTQGALKYGFYEVFKPIIGQSFESYGLDIHSVTGKLLIFGLSGALADLIGSSVLSPFESARIRLVATPGFANGLFDSLTKLINTEGFMSLYVGLPPILFRQIPYTTVQLASFELITSQLYSNLPLIGLHPEDASYIKFGITFISAFIAAILASLASQPGDTLLSRVNSCTRDDSCSTINPIDVMREAVQELGLSGLFRGTKARIVHVTVMVIIQLLTYDFLKELCGIPATGLVH